MTLAQAVAAYVKGRRALGSPFVSSEATLRMFCSQCGNIELRQVTAERISGFLDAGQIAQITRVSRFSALKCFVEHCSARGMLPNLWLTRPLKPTTHRAPFIYTREQIRALLQATEACQSNARELTGDTFRMVLILLYATGATVGEALSILRSDVDAKRRLITIRARGPKAARILPLGAPLQAALSQYFSMPVRAREPSDSPLFGTPSGGPLNPRSLDERFRRLRLIAGVEAGVNDGTPRLQDLRYTFAVHRLKCWIGSGTNLSLMLPALSAYMGYTDLNAAEQFLAYTPDRFRADLQKLSPRKSRSNWRNDPALMAFLTQI